MWLSHEVGSYGLAQRLGPEVRSQGLVPMSGSMVGPKVETHNWAPKLGH